MNPKRKAKLIEIMVDFREIIRRGEDCFEDMGGGIWHESEIGGQIEYFLENLTVEERAEINKELEGL